MSSYMAFLTSTGYAMSLEGVDVSPFTDGLSWVKQPICAPEPLQRHLTQRCPYCGTLHNSSRCESCGAPRTERKEPKSFTADKGPTATLF